MDLNLQLRLKKIMKKAMTLESCHFFMVYLRNVSTTLKSEFLAKLLLNYTQHSGLKKMFFVKNKISKMEKMYILSFQWFLFLKKNGRCETIEITSYLSIAVKLSLKGTDMVLENIELISLSTSFIINQVKVDDLKGSKWG